MIDAIVIAIGIVPSVMVVFCFICVTLNLCGYDVEIRRRKE